MDKEGGPQLEPFMTKCWGGGGIRVPIIHMYTYDILETFKCYRDRAAERSLTKFLVKQSSIWLVLLTHNASTLVICTPRLLLSSA